MNSLFNNKFEEVWCRFALRRAKVIYKYFVEGNSCSSDVMGALKQLSHALVTGSSAMSLPECLPALEQALIENEHDAMPRLGGVETDAQAVGRGDGGRFALEVRRAGPVRVR